MKPPASERLLSIAILALASSVLVCLLAPQGTGQVRSKTLRDEVRAKGFAKHREWEDLPLHEPHTLEQLVKRSDLIVQGEVVNETARLSEDETALLTDYTVEVSDVLKDARKRVSVGDRLIVSKFGGSVTIEGKPVQVESTTFPAIPWRTRGIFFVVRADKPNHFWEASFSLSNFGVWLFKNGRFACETERKKTIGFTAGQCNRPAADVEATLKRLIANPGGAQP